MAIIELSIPAALHIKEIITHKLLSSHAQPSQYNCLMLGVVMSPINQAPPTALVRRLKNSDQIDQSILSRSYALMLIHK